MVIKKSYPISGVVVTPANIRELANKINDEYKKDIESIEERKREYCRIKLLLRSFDGTQYESQDMAILAEEGILSKRKIVAVEIFYHNHFTDKLISLRLRHSLGKDYFNDVEIQGRDEDWTNGVLSTIKEIISNWREQKKWFDKYRVPLVFIPGAIIGWSLINIVNFIGDLFYKIFDPRISVSKEFFELLKSLSPYLYIVLYLFYFSWGCEIAHSILKKIGNLYPDIELLTGPEHLQVEEQKRRKLNKLLIIGILPFIISLVIEIFF